MWKLMHFSDVLVHIDCAKFDGSQAVSISHLVFGTDQGAGALDRFDCVYEWPMGAQWITNEAQGAGQASLCETRCQCDIISLALLLVSLLRFTLTKSRINQVKMRGKGR
jgi:hypothetical protein